MPITKNNKMIKNNKDKNSYFLLLTLNMIIITVLLSYNFKSPLLNTLGFILIVIIDIILLFLLKHIKT
ncbi:MAG: hypothetical protein GXN95_05380 [Methanococci archaeon]|nr:hypothetical protein [Methanococci archaeon]